MPFAISPTIPAGSLSSSTQPALLSPDGALRLRPWRAEDTEVLLRAYRDPTIRRWHVRHVLTQDEATRWIADYARFWQQETAVQWVITDAADDEALGRMALRTMNLQDGVAECAYWVLPAARGRGVAPRALAALTEWAVGTAGFHRLELVHSVHNEASCRVAVKSGFALEGTRRESHLHADGWHDTHLHGYVAGRAGELSA
ncbi:GNAT family N-acetyltransferase [Streptomyces sp. NBC_01304]|uniref:GNAT family N-acetyltransferase n=1 Tax=Streptomyces sp. NBC_01304 TaxID=2903818 RepID=UPI002E0EB9D3|nr:GNAT family N-acetyltransferase [Streptomyces sp. NBC_01304]